MVASKTALLLFCGNATIKQVLNEKAKVSYQNFHYISSRVESALLCIDNTANLLKDLAKMLIRR